MFANRLITAIIEYNTVKFTLLFNNPHAKVQKILKPSLILFTYVTYSSVKPYLKPSYL